MPTLPCVALLPKRFVEDDLGLLGRHLGSLGRVLGLLGCSVGGSDVGLCGILLVIVVLRRATGGHESCKKADCKKPDDHLNSSTA